MLPEFLNDAVKILTGNRNVSISAVIVKSMFNTSHKEFLSYKKSLFTELDSSSTRGVKVSSSFHANSSSCAKVKKNQLPQVMTN
jgi:hypothetical protein